MYIYKITNNINKKIYIGKSTDSRPHKKISYYGSGKLIQLAIGKYGVENFTKEIIDTCCTNEELCQKEIYWISYYNSSDLNIGYNISNGGDGGNTISNHPNKIDIVNKISNSLKGRVFSDEHKENLIKNHHSKLYDDSYLKVSKALKDKPKTNTHRKNLSNSIKELYNNGFKSSFQTDNPMQKNKYVWIVNKLTGETKRIIYNVELPDGFVYGRSNIKYINKI
jgi:group I intron endonuclease